MKRSQINSIIEKSIQYLNEQNFYLPEWAYWTFEVWQKHASQCKNIFNANLGWDVFSGADDFYKIGAVLFTIRNGVSVTQRPYCEKIIILEEGQELPHHYHKDKTEDIICRSEGALGFQISMANSHNTLKEESVVIEVDGIEKTLGFKEEFVLGKGQSLTLYPLMYHKFYAKKNKILVGEVSKINDDNTDNFFLEDIKRFPAVEEDEDILYPLVNDYATLL